MNRHGKIALVASIILLATACGDFYGTRTRRAPKDAYSHEAEDPSVAFDGDYQLEAKTGYYCPPRENVLPDFDWAVDGTGRFKVCLNPAHSQDILVHGETATSDSICVFPANFDSQKGIYAFVKEPSGAPVKQCGKAPPSEEGLDGIKITFASGAFDSVYISEGGQAGDAMQACLYSGIERLCPPYSVGKIRK